MSTGLQSSRSSLVVDMPWDEVAGRLKGGATAILPVGSGAKQHGWHMPMGVDALLAEWFAVRFADWIDALIWPTLTYGTYPAFVAYPGSITLRDPTFESLVHQIVSGLRDSGAKSVIILDVGHSTIARVERAISGFPSTSGIRQVSIRDGERYRRAVAEHARQAHGSHADEVETSIVLAVAPHLVWMERAQASPALTGGPMPGPLTPTDAQSPNYAPSGSFGDPTLASAAKGRFFVEAILDDLREAAGIHPPL